MNASEAPGSAPEVFLSLILPAYNESRRIGLTLQKTVDYLAKMPYTWEIIVVDDGSTDHTADVARKAMKHVPGICILANTPNQGKGYSVKTGILRARGRYAGFMDADYKTDITCTADALERLDAGCDVVIGSRRLDTSRIETQPKLYRRVASRLFNTYLRLMIPDLKHHRDTQCGFKFFRTEAAGAIFSRTIINRFMFDAELLYLAHRLKYNITEIPVRWASDPDSRTTFISGIFRNAIDLFRIRLAHRRIRPSSPAPVKNP